MSPAVELRDRAGRPAAIEGPSDPVLARLWDLAREKFARDEGRGPGELGDWHRVMRLYDGLVAKRHGSLGRVIEERCHEAPGGD